MCVCVCVFVFVFVCVLEGERGVEEETGRESVLCSRETIAVRESALPTTLKGVAPELNPTPPILFSSL